MRNDKGIKLLLFQIGQRVRSLRALRSITRRELSEGTQISERYLGQLENGQANVSLTIVQRIAHFFNIPVEDLLTSSAQTSDTGGKVSDFINHLTPSEQEEALQMLQATFKPQQRDIHGIALLGLRGAGKSTYGAKLSELLNFPFMRLSQLVTERAGLGHNEIFELWGGKAFRRLEKEVLDDLIEGEQNVILETSGGMVASEQSYSLLLKNYYTIWVKASPKDHMQRVIDQNDLRPIEGRREAMKDLITLLSERHNAYSQADYVLDTSERSIKDCLGELVEQIVPIIAKSTSGTKKRAAELTEG